MHMYFLECYDISILSYLCIGYLSIEMQGEPLVISKDDSEVQNNRAAKKSLAAYAYRVSLTAKLEISPSA